MNEPTREGHPVGPEVDDSANPTHSAPAHEQHTPAGDADAAAAQPGGVHQAIDVGADEAEAQRESRDMLRQLQAMIDSLATQARPAMREVAAKAAELAAVAGQKAGPVAHRAAQATERVGVRVAERSREMASELRRQGATEQADPASDQTLSDAPPVGEVSDNRPKT